MSEIDGNGSRNLAQDAGKMNESKEEDKEDDKQEKEDTKQSVCTLNVEETRNQKCACV